MSSPDHTPTRRCSKCGAEYPASTEYFRRQKGGKYGLTSRCKSCLNLIHQDWLANGGRTWMKEWSHSEAGSRKRKRYRDTHQEKIRKYDNRPDVKANRRLIRSRYNARHKDELKAKRQKPEFKIAMVVRRAKSAERTTEARQCAYCHKTFYCPRAQKNRYCSRSCSKLGSNNPQWLHGKSTEEYPAVWNRKLRRMIRERDSYTCAICGSCGRDVHHIDYNKTNCSPGNLIVLCHSCHSKTNTNRSYWQAFFENIKADPSGVIGQVCMALGIEDGVEETQHERA